MTETVRLSALAMRFPNVPAEQLRCPEHGDELVYCHNWRRTYACGCLNLVEEMRTRPRPIPAWSQHRDAQK